MKEQILKLREEGNTHAQIASLLKCSKGTVSYYCSSGQKEKSLKRQQSRRNSNTLICKIDHFKNRNISGKERNRLKLGEECNFTLQDVKDKFGENPICYLSGRKINLLESKSFHFDHIIPASKDGKNTLENLGITDASINLMKSDSTVNEFILNCKEILEYNGYLVTKI